MMRVASKKRPEGKRKSRCDRDVSEGNDRMRDCF